MDYVYIRVFGMGVEGAAWATLTGYTAGAVIVAVLLAGKKIRVRATRDIVRSMDLMGEIIKRGGPDALTQIGFSLQFAFINAVAGNLAGTAGILAFSLCIQMNSIVSIFVGSLIGSSVPFLSVLHGQRDFRKKDQNAYMDILARIYKGNVEIDFRSLGPFFDPFEEADEDIKENIRLLRGIASKIENEYVLGMNSTRITIEAA